jgi:hypothetical protein
MTTVFAIATRNRLFQARTLFQSVAHFEPTVGKVLFLVDPVDGEALQLDGVTIVPAAAAVCAGFTAMAFEHTGPALCCALKPFCARYVLMQLEQTAAVYLDTDTLVLSGIAELVNPPPDASILLTPHLLQPINGPAVPRDEIDIIESGIFNAGVIGFRRSDSCTAILEWWASRMRWRRNVREQFAYDQHWLDLANNLFEGVRSLRDPGYNVGYWNLHERPLGRDKSDNLIVGGGARLRIFHFSFFDSNSPEWLVNQGTIHVSVQASELKDLALGYAESLRRNGRDMDSSNSYRFSAFDDGHPISEEQRQYFAERLPEEVKMNANPFDPAFAWGHMRGWRSIYRRNHLGVQAGLRLARFTRRLFTQSCN